MTLFVTNSTIANENDETTIEIEFTYYEYRDVRDATNDFFNLRVTYDLCDEFNETNESRFMCKSHAYERAITIDA